MDPHYMEDLKKDYERLSTDGFRVLAIATKDVAARGNVADGTTPYGKADECDLILNGYVAFLDPPKETATAAIKDLQGHGVLVKVLTGDNDLVARKICKEVVAVDPTGKTKEDELKLVHGRMIRFHPLSSEDLRFPPTMNR